MKKSVVVSIRNAAKTDFGGGEKVPVYIAREVMRETPEVQVVVCSHSDKLLSFAKDESVTFRKTWWWSRQNWSGGKALLFPLYVIWQLILTVYYVVLFLRLHVRVVHLQSKDDFIAGTIAARLVGAHVFWSDYADLKHIWKNHSVWYKNPVGKLVFLIAHAAETIIVVSEEDKRLIMENMPGNKIASKMRVVYNGAFDHYKGVAKNKQFTVVSASRLVTDKGVGELITAFQKFSEIHKDTKLEILGDGPEKDHFVEMAKDIPSITFLGHQKEPSRYLERAHVFAMPTYHEGFSLALVEACMLGLAVVATRVGGNTEIIKHEYNGILIDAKNSEALYQAFEKLYGDKQLRETLAANARQEYLDNFNFHDLIIDHFLPLYRGKKS